MAILIMGGLEIIGVASILPFMQLIAEENAIEKSRWLTKAYNFFQFESEKQMLVSFGIGIIVIIGLTNLFSIITMWWQYKFSWSIAHNVGTRLLSNYLIKPYRFYLDNNTAKVQSYVTSEINSLTGGILIPIIEIVSKSVVAIVIFAILLVVDFKVSMIMFVGLGGAYTLIFLSRQKFIKRIGEYRIEMNTLRYKTLKEVLGGIKTVMIYHKQNFFFERYEHASKEFTDIQPKFNVILAAPKYVLEFIAFGGILGVTIYLYVTSGGIQSAIPRLSLYAVAGYRLLPALQSVFSSIAKVKHSYPIIDKIFDELDIESTNRMKVTTSKEKLAFKKTIEIENLAFKYEENAPYVVDHLNITIEKGQTVAFIGSTGSGKTTLVDIIVGLLTANEGHIKVDGKVLGEKEMLAWQNNISYVPQEVFLFDDTVMNNIAMTEKSSDIDIAKVTAAAGMAEIHSFIENEMPNGYQSKIGERGVRLSGGQRQRLGMARALYSEPDLLVLDEATSALDSITESGVIDSIQSLPGTITTIIIAHRLSTVKHADMIYFLKDGKIVANGDYNSLMHSSTTFKTMVELS